MKHFALLCVFAFAQTLVSSSGHAAGIIPVHPGTIRTSENNSNDPNMKYYGGPVISHVKLVTLFWGNNVPKEIKDGIGAFYSSIVNSSYIDALSEYHTSTQTIGRGSVGEFVTISPKNPATTMDKRDVEAELEYQLGVGAIPKPDANTLYMIHYPVGVTLTTGGIASCQEWCADHEGFESKNFGKIYYAMMPECNDGESCAIGGRLKMTGIYASHEIAESISDPMAPNIGESPKFPAGWIKDQDEIGDVCLYSITDLSNSDRSYKVQAVWSNQKSACNTGPYSNP